MKVDLDTIIFLGFLIVNLGVGLFYGSGIKTVREYAVGNRDFSTGTIAATLVATCIGGGFFSGATTESYKQGLYFIIPAMGEPLALIIVGYFLAPRLGEFLGTISIAEAMGNLFGKYVKFITALSGIFLCIGILALQFKVSGTILQLFFGLNSYYSVLVSAIIVIIYSAFGGIKAVTFTDIIQFLTFSTVIPLLSLVIWGTLDDPTKVFVTLSNNNLFDYTQVFDFHNPRFLSSVLLLLFFIIPGFQPVFFQRALMAKNTAQIRKSFLIAGSICLCMFFIIVWVSILLLSDNPNLDPNNLFAYIITQYSYPGLKGLIAVGVMSIVMSTADSYINSAAVLFTNDIFKPLSFQDGTFQKQLLISRIFAVSVGVFAFFLAFKASNILELLLLTLSFYAPVVSVPLLMAIFGFRSSSKSVLAGMAAGVSAVITLELLHVGVDSVIPGMAANLTVLLSSHYLLKQPGGWVGIKDDRALIAARDERAKFLRNLLLSIRTFNFLQFCKNNCPRNEMILTYFGLFSLVSVFSTMYSIPHYLRLQHSQILDVIYHSVLISSTAFLTYPIWPPLFKRKNFINVFWIIGIFYIPIFVGGLLMIISGFSQFQSMIFMVNLIITSVMIRWQLAIIVIFGGVFAAINFFKLYMGVSELPGVTLGLQFKITYALLMVISIMIAFLKPKQKSLEISEKRNNDLKKHNRERTIELIKTLEVKKEILRNVSHEIRMPVRSLNDTLISLGKNWSKWDDEIKREYIAEGSKVSKNLYGLVNSILDYSKLSSNKIGLTIEEINFKEVIAEIINECKILYLGKKEIQFIINSEVKWEYFFADKSLFSQMIRNLIMNAIQFSNSGTITVLIKSFNMICPLYNEENNQSRGTELVPSIEFNIIDEGIGIPEAELETIFESFTQSSRTENPEKLSKGIGLALVKKIVEGHLGEVYAKNNSKRGATFIIRMPKNPVYVKHKRIILNNPEILEKPLPRLKRSEIPDSKKELVNMLLKDNVNITFISRLTDLSEEEVEEIGSKS